MSCGGRSSATYSLITAHILLIYHCHMALGGICWSAMRGGSGRCTELLLESSSREQCCSSYGGVATAWSPDALDSGALFFWRVLGGGVPCNPCKESCAGVQCGPEKRCMMRNGRPKCVCAPKCGSMQQQHHLLMGAGAMRATNTIIGHTAARAATQAVCGTDGRSYRNLCRLKKRACRRRRSANLAVAYYGTCQTSCHSISCPSGQHCLLDQNLRPHCVRCTRKCTASSRLDAAVAGSSNHTRAVTSRRRVCGSDGNTYASVCHLREAACRRGKAIPLAYRGSCRASATCATVRCHNRQTCLRDRSALAKVAARCVSCHLRVCAATDNTVSAVPNRSSGGSGAARKMALASGAARLGEHAHNSLLCASDNQTYNSWCQMMHEACSVGEVIETRHAGQCVARNIIAEHF